MTTITADTGEGIADNEAVLRLRIVTVDHYMAEPNVGFDDMYSVFRQNQIKRVPVVRVFGITVDGVKTCLHVHRVYPYLSVRFESKLDDDYELQKQQFMTQLVKQLESHLMPNVRTRNNIKESPNDQLIYDIQEVNAIVSELLLSGQIMDRQIQPFEAHIPYTLQFLIDNNLQGMNFLSAKRVDYRKTDALGSGVLYSDTESISSCQLECDIDFRDILNRQTNVKNGRLPGLEAIWAEELKRCNNSQELLNLKGVASQERSNIPSTNLETFHMKRLFEGLSKLNLILDANQNVSSPQLSASNADESDFAEMMVQCIDDKQEESSSDEISQTIEDVINSSQSLAINQTIEDVIINSQNNIISQTIEEVVNESQRQNKCRTKQKKKARKRQSRKRLNFNNSLEESDEELHKSTDELSVEECKTTEKNIEYPPDVLYVDAGTQTELKDSSIDSVFGFGDEIEEIVCDCDSDECCDQCCDRGSDQCECDCERCEFEKCKKIPQLDGAFDSDDSGSNFSPAFKDDSADSDFEVNTNRSKKGRFLPKKGGKRTKSTRNTPSKRKKSVANDSDSDLELVDSYSERKTSTQRRPAARRKSPAFSDEDIFESTSDRKSKVSKNKSETLFEKFTSNNSDRKKRRTSGSPIRMSFSESDGSGKETGPLSFLSGLKDYSFPSKQTSPKKNNDDNRSERSSTPYLSHESEDELPPKTKPGPRFSKASDAPKPGPKSTKPGPMSAKPGPKSSKPGPKSSKPVPKAGPKSSKTSTKPGPKSSKKSGSISLSSDPENDGLISTVTTSRSRRTTKSVNYDDTIERTTSFYTEEPTPRKRAQLAVRGSGKPKSAKSEIDSAVDSISSYIIPDEVDDLIDDSYKSSADYLRLEDQLKWKSINGHSIQIDVEFYGKYNIESLGKERLECKATPEYIVNPYLRRYETNIEYWDEVRDEVEAEIKLGHKPKAGTRSKGALKDFYTLPHLNDRKSPEKTERAQNKSKPLSSAKKTNTNKSNECARLMADASYIIDKPLGKRGVSQSKKKATPKTATKSLPKRGNSSNGKSSASKRGAQTNSNKSRSTRVPKGVTSSTLFNSINIPFYDSDIIVVTELTGYKKKAYLKSMCAEFELEVKKLPKHYLKNYVNHNISPFLFDNIYYNDYSGYLADEQSRESQDVLVTVKNLIIDVVSVSQSVDSLINEVCNEFEPKPMIDTRMEDCFDEEADVDQTDDWGYDHYDEDEHTVIGVAVDSGVAVTAKEDDYEYQPIETNGDNISPDIGINGTNDPLSDILMKTLGDNEDEENVMSCQQIEDINKSEEQNNCEDKECENEDQNSAQHSANEEEQEEEDEDLNYQQSEQNFDGCAQEGAEDVEQSYDMCAQQYSAAPQSHEYSNQSNGNYMEQSALHIPHYEPQNQYEEEEEEEEEADQSSENSNSSPSNQIMEQTVEPEFKLQSHYNNEMYGFGVTQTQNQNMVFQQNPLQNPIVPTLLPENSHHYPNTSTYASQQWPHSSADMVAHTPPLQPQYSSMPTLNSQTPPQPDNEFDVSNYNYMSYYSNPNIPQFDGIFDDDDIQNVGKPFNMRCSSDETIKQLSQGSRSEEASPKKHATDIVAEALLAGSSVDRQKTSEVVERYGYYISGVVVKIPKSLPEQCLQQFGREYVPLDPMMDSILSDSHHSIEEFTEKDCKSFWKTSLTGSAKFVYLQSLCNKNIRITLNRLNCNEIDSNSKNNSFISVSSLLKSNKKFISLNNNKKLCIESNLSSVKSKSNASTVAKCLPNNAFEIDEIPESPLNESSKCEDMEEEIYSFYSDNTLSLDLSQSTQQFSQMYSQLDAIPASGSSDYSNKQHSTPMNNHKFKPFSQTLTETQKALDLSSKNSPNTSFSLFSGLSPNISSKEPIVANNKRINLLRNDSLIEGPTPSTTFDYEFSSVDESPVDSDYEYQYLTTMSVEIHVSTRAKLNPDPKSDAIEALFYSIDCDRPPDPSQRRRYITGVIVVESDVETIDCSTSFNVIKHNRLRSHLNTVGALKGINVDFADDEIVLLMKFVEVVKKYDPDIIVGYKIDTLSWGYILERANILNMSILTPLSRINDEKYSRNIEGTQNSKCELTGRITLNLWSIMRSEVTLNQYNYENCHYHVLHERIPSFSFEKLTQLYANRFNPLNRRRVIDYYLRRTVGSLRLIDKLDFIGKTSELARLFGIQFQEVFNRGTQFRVESIMLRFSRLMDYIPISPSHQQVSTQRAPEILPLILEPESKYYTDPVVVLDFQSLYPSMMIAYNYCYSTCLGKVDQLIRSTDLIDFGCFELEVNKQLLLQYQNDVHISPNGVVFLKSNVRKGILPKMLEEILETRVMVKNAMKANNKKPFPNKGLNRKLDARQLGLKLIANVTYGYTSASFSGRMPCVEIADSIVAKGRETLERAINLVRDNKEWGADVVYGDTDSLFIHFKGISKEEAFRRGKEIAEVITQQNPKPVRLKFEKVYLPCVLETKKRYVGFSYESPEQKTPIFDAKGIETVRRDTCPAVSKMLEKSLRILFTTNEVNGVKQYLMRQFQKILNGRVSILEDFVFAREYRGADSYSSKSHVPSAEIAKRRAAIDPRNEPKVKERVPYVVIAGPPNEQLFKLVKEPLDLVNDPSLRLNSQYYIEKVIIPALNRVFQLMGQDVNKWYKEMPKKIHYQRYHYLLGRESKTGRRTIPQFFNTTQCCVCGENCKESDFCSDCLKNKSEAIASVSDQVRDIHLKYSSVLKSCKQCSASTDSDIHCQSIECPNLFRYHQSKLDLMNANYLTNIVNKYF